MADYIFIRKSRNALSTVLHIFLKILLGLGAVFITVITSSPLLGLLLVIIAKWRIFAVRPRFWWVNIKANLVDIIVGVAIVLLSFLVSTELSPLHFILSVLYIVWLIIVKPQTSDFWLLVQSLTAIFLGTSTTFLLVSGLGLNNIYTVISSAIIGYASARHIFIQSSKNTATLISFVCGLLFAELSWITSSWNIIYSFDSLDIMIPQFSLIITIFSFAFASVYRSFSNHDGNFHPRSALPPIIFACLTIATLFLFFSSPIYNI